MLYGSVRARRQPTGVPLELRAACQGTHMRMYSPSPLLLTVTQPGGHLFLSTISRTLLSYFLTILSAEKILHLVEPGTHTYSKYITPSELISFFRNYQSPPSDPNSKETSKPKPWISTPPAPYTPLRTQAETRGIIYLPWNSEWVLAPRDGITKRFTEECNYLFWVRKPLE